MLTGTQRPERYSEEDIRAQVVLRWLAGLGFGLSDIRVERSFEVRLGRRRKTVTASDPDEPEVFRPRADVLVRHIDQRNLLIVEVKAPGEPLDDEARQQGISYARLLQDGGIAPFVVLTNGSETRIFDTITGEEIQGESILSTHRHVRNGFRVTSDVLELRAEALERLVSLNSSNLVAFCQDQVRFRMRALRSDDPTSGRKYIPSMYVERPDPQGRLDTLIDQGKPTILLVGPPQVGKTNILCRGAERRLELGLPALFYSANAVGGLLDEIREDFQWIFKQGLDTHALVAERLASVARSCGQRIVVFIDGWNEATIETARSIDRCIGRMSSADVTFVISFTDIAARRLLRDPVGDPTEVADSVGLTLADLRRLELGWGQGGSVLDSG